MPWEEETPLLEHNSHHSDEDIAQEGQQVRNRNYEDEFAPAPIINRTAEVSWTHVALLFVTGAFSLPTFVAGIDIFETSPSWKNSLWAVLIGNLLLATTASLTGTVGACTRFHSYLLAQVAFGRYGAAVLNSAFAVSLLGWFAVNLNLFVDSVQQLVDNDEASSASLNRWLVMYLVPILGGLVMTMTTMYGFWALETLSLLLAPILALVTVVLLVKSWERYADQGAATVDMDTAGPITNSITSNSSSLGDAVSSVAGLSMVGAIIAPDYTRFIRQKRTGAVSSAFVSYALVQTIVECSGGFATLVFQESNLLAIMKSIHLEYEAFVLLIAGSWILNAMNLYSLALSLEATFLSLPGCCHTERRYVVGVAGMLGTILSMTCNILDYFLIFLYWLSVTFAPVAGVVVVDYVVRRSQYEESSLIEGPEHVVRLSALVAWLLGITCAFTGTMTGISALDAFLLAAFSYFIIMKYRIIVRLA